MLIDLHAHLVHPGFYDVDPHPHWGPFFDEGEGEGEGGALRLRVGNWTLTLGQGERREQMKKGTAPNRAQFMKNAANPQNRLRAMDAAGQDAQVVCIPSHTYMYWTEPEFSVAYAKKCNKVMADYCAGGENRLFFWAHAPLNVPEACPQIIRDAVASGYAVGIAAGGANFGGLEFDSPELYPVWETMCELDLPIFVHGYNQSVTWGDKANTDKYETTSIIGMNADEAMAFWRLICGGVLDKFPNLKIYITHAGGFVPYQLGRLEETNKNLETTFNKEPISYYMKNFWFDPEIHDIRMRQAMVDIIGADHLLYGTNFGGSDAIRYDMTEGLTLSAEDRDKIRFANACKLLHLDANKLGRAKEAPVGAVALPN